MSGPADGRFASGRTRAQGGGSAVLEGRVLYVTPRGEELIREAMARCVATSRLERSAVACLAAGAISLEVTCFVSGGLPLTAIIVDHDLVQNPEHSADDGVKRSGRRGSYVAVPKKRDRSARGRLARAESARLRADASQVALPSQGSES